MKLAGKVWNTLPQQERFQLLRACRSELSDSLKEHESTLKWDELWPLTQDALLKVDFSAILGRDVAP